MESKSTTITTAAAPVAFGLTEGLIEKFSGDDKSYSSSKWAQDIEDNAEIFQWTPQQTLIVARRSLTGTAELWLKSEKAFKTYGDLKAALVKEFPDTANVKEMHELMAARKKLKGETYYQYMLHMKELARRAKFPDYIAIQYIVDGIDDYESNKVILYGVTTFPALKEKLAFYEKMKSKTREREKRTERLKGHARSAEASSAASGSARRCYSCGDMGHEAGVCKNGLKCFGCNQFGHIRNQCPVNPMRSTATASASGHSGAKMAGAGGSGAHGGRGGGASGSGEAGKLGPKRPAAMFGTVNEVSGNETVRAVIDNETSLTLTDVNTVNVTATIPPEVMPYDVIIGQEFLGRVTVVMNEGGCVAVNVDHIQDPAVRSEVMQCVEEYKPLYKEEAPIQLQIVLKDDIPVRQRPRRLSLMEQQVVEDQIEEWLDKGIVRVSFSDYSSPLVLVKKKDGSTRVCVDYRQVNKKIVKDEFPLPVIHDLIDKLQEAKVFSVLDLKSGFFHLKVSEESIKYTSFVTHHGQFEFLRAPFALDEVQAVSRLKQVLEVAAHYGLEINWKKANLLQREVEYLGHRVKDGEVRPSTDKVDAVISGPVLKIFNPKLKTELHTDASGVALAAILMQHHPGSGLHPVHYMSKKTTDIQSRYSSYELEALAIIEGIRKFRHYLYGIPFKIVTDCKAFELTLKKKDLSAKVARWVLMLSEYDFEVEHRAGSRMQHADALSRIPTVAVVTTLQESLRQAQDQDDGIKAIKEILRGGSPYDDYWLENGVLYKTEQKLFVVPRSLEKEIINRVHSKGHFGKSKMKELLNKEYYIRDVDKKMQDFLLSCIPCLLATRKEGKQEGFLNPIEKEGVPFDTLHLDHIGPLTETRKQYNYILTVIDGFTKFVWLFPTKTTSSSETLRKIQIHQQIFGNPRRFITDRGTAFTSNEFKSYCEEEKISHVKITTGVPRGNGQVERVHRILIPVLTKLCLENPAVWYKHVSKVQRALNSTFQRSINTTPFELLMGVKMKGKEDLEILQLLQEENTLQYDENREKIRQQAKEQILKIQEENKKQYDRKRKESSKYKEGDLVAIKRTQFGPGLKLKPKYLGPYRVVKCKRKDRYDVEKLDSSVEGPQRSSSSADQMKRWPQHGDAEMLEE
nr:uncharacterized protein LOC126053899 [Helicoverpa armigera]XP_049695188.1 uncharacterized protein LOC126054290 [Helicoverpa armigera]XP_049704767.1 uncharacterized protein LOC126056282 [Helicoverpa armigera]